jgi:hypothetical protein
MTESYLGVKGRANYLNIWIDPYNFHFEAY